ncbi:MFS transporter [Rosenbergiella sp. S61]|uniref:MFS transporter n=1 Tax=Rosenbergiella gaditana TaxID=2726987 RepID=A0ABS5T045_9GAMM|nr:MFS transporter [Rosenbergiella gaditana]MBT0725699.1 MFS transporter [Rosenbergiella gaditana]
MMESDIKISPAIFLLIAGAVSLISSLGAPLIPAISVFYSIPPEKAQWSLSVTLMSATIFTPILASISSSGNFKKVISISLFLTTIGCFLCSFCNIFSVFLVGRFLQGIGMAVVPSLMTAARYLTNDVKKTVSLLSITTAVGIGLGYPFSGLLTSMFGMHLTFFFGGCMVILSLFLSFNLKDIKNDRMYKFDIVGSFAMSFTIIIFLLLCDQIKSKLNLFNISILFLLLLCSMFFWYHLSKNNSNSIINISVLKNTSVYTANIIVMLSGMIMYVLISASMYRIQQVVSPGLNLSPLVAGAALTPLSVFTIVSRYINLNNLSDKSRLLLGSLGLIVSMVLLGVSNTVFSTVFSLGICGYAIGIIYGSAPHIISSGVEDQQLHEAFGLNQISRSIGYSIGSVVTMNILSTFYSIHGSPSVTSYLLISLIGLICSIFLSLIIILSFNKIMNNINTGG